MWTSRALGFLVWVTLLSWSKLCASQDDASAYPPSFYSTLPSLEISVSNTKGCPKGSCADVSIVAGSCYNFVEDNGVTINDNLQSLKLAQPGGPRKFLQPAHNFMCRIFSEYDCFGQYIDVTATTPDFTTAYPNFYNIASSIKCGTKNQTVDELMLITGKVNFCTGENFTGSCSIIYPYHTRCYDLSTLSQQTNSVQFGHGIYCRLYSATGCGGSFVQLPMEGSTSLDTNQGFKNLAVSFKCSAALDLLFS